MQRRNVFTDVINQVDDVWYKVLSWYTCYLVVPYYEMDQADAMF